MKKAKKIISVILVVTMVTLNLPLTVFADENDIINMYKEYNKGKISLYPYLVELFKAGSKTSIGQSQDVYTKDGRRIATGKQPEYEYSKNKISWWAFSGERAFTEAQLYELLGLEKEAEEALKANKKGRSMFYGGLAAFGVGFLLICASANSSETTETKTSMPGVLLSAGGAFTAYYGNRRVAIRIIDYISMYKLVKKYNIELLSSYFADVKTGKYLKEIDKINDFDSLYRHAYRGIEEKDRYRDKDFDQKRIAKGMTKKEVLAVCGYPFVTDNYESLSSWEYAVENKTAKMFDFGRLTGESFNYTIYTLYFKENKLVDWTEQNYSS